MSKQILVPDIGDFENVEIIEVLVKPGDSIKKDDPLITLESDKSSVEVPSTEDGVIENLNVKVGDKVSKGSLLAKLENGATNSLNDKPLEKIETTNEKLIEVKQSPAREDLEQEVKKVKKVFAQATSEDDIDPQETSEWIESLNAIIENDGPSRASYVLNKIIKENFSSL